MKRMIAIVTALVLCLSLLPACSIVTGFEYDHPEQYSSGSADIHETVNAIDIRWLSGHLKLETWDEDYVSLTEEANKVLDDELIVRWWLDGTTLRVRYGKSGFIKDLMNGVKTLTIRVPETVLDRLDIDSASADIVLDHVQAEQLSVDTASGPVDGSVDYADRLELDSASGRVNLTVQSVRDAEADSASGDVTLQFRSQPEKVELDSASGDVKLILPSACEFKAVIDTASGSFRNDFSARKDGSTYTVGSGTASVSISTASGDIELKKGA